MRVFDALEKMSGGEYPGSVVALVFFDGVNAGHRALLCRSVQEARRQGLTPGVFTFRTGSRRPASKREAAALLTEEQKWDIFDTLGLEFCLCPPFEEVAALQPQDFFTSVLLDKMGAKGLCCGRDYRFGQGAVGNVALLRELCEAQGIGLTVVEEVVQGETPVRSTRIRELLLAGEAEQAARLMGRPLMLDTPVIKGNQLGRTIGSPTINQEFPPGFLIPRYGVYATLVQVDGKSYAGVTNVGVKPTVGSPMPLSETYILDFSGDLYGQRIRVYFLQFLRPEQKFASIDALKEKIQENAATARGIVEEKKGDFEG